MTWKQVTLLTSIVGATAVMIDVGTMSAIRANIYGVSPPAYAKTTTGTPRGATNPARSPHAVSTPKTSTISFNTKPTANAQGSSQTTSGGSGGSSVAKTPSSPSPPSYPSFGLDTVGPQVLALNERLAELGYLPVTIQGSTMPSISVDNIMTPPTATFAWKYPNTPTQLAGLWQPNFYSPITRAAVMAVERANGLPVDGIVGSLVWHAILKPNALIDPNPYTYVLVNKSAAPETLKLWTNGNWMYQSICNTGISGYNTTDGTYAVYLRFQSQTMRGKNPNGSTYNDAGVPYVNYFDGSQAIHGYVRATYGFPQSLGCVELPISHAKTLWPLIHYGTLVTIEGHYGSSSTPATPATPQSTSSGSQPSTADTTTTAVYGVHSNS